MSRSAAVIRSPWRRVLTFWVIMLATVNAFMGNEHFTWRAGAGVLGRPKPRTVCAHANKPIHRTTSPAWSFDTYVWLDVTVALRDTIAALPGTHGMRKNTWPCWR